ncbi:hypothetical protein BCV72DRAFT_238035 [Rhizopus microsporus var. microsporus]|uniref:CHY-type domain-containing protein n=2 Tax=Rhizopus microsporus TaxID=58291 RepID=A0A2G4SU05_RHIZD|nr:uncharacterized protein RHIMIDRAFT_238055 [Rhizopus microsporus ATCC 52813]ORE11352.1 hypothetical protein BCV72DRAFT_238035 [Rhizopus microsporus var. microsporus]PHZ12241.1 hypothetical protein RHIMIDRAFT_238055 [Rhizopus microsporus ATCC 52813]
MTDKPNKAINNNNKSSVSTDNKRKLELIQLETRYRSTYQLVKDNEQETVVRIAIKPTDPDFPYELDALQVQLHIPNTYPEAPCKIQVLNNDIPRGFAFNLEKGYAAHVDNMNTHQTLVRQMNWLDRNMETLLQQAPAPTVRFVSHSPKPTAAPATTEPQQDQRRHHLDTTKPIIHQSASSNPRSYSPPKQVSVSKSNTTSAAASSHSEVAHTEEDIYAPKEKAAADERRKREIQQLRTRFADSFKSTKSNTVIHLTLNINDPEFSHEQHLGGTQLYIKYHIPRLYPLQPCSIEVENRNLDATRKSWIEGGFNMHVVQSRDSLFENLNWLNRYLEQLISGEQRTQTREEQEAAQMADAQKMQHKPPTQEQKKSMLSASAPVFVPQVQKKKKTSLFDEEDQKQSRVVIVNDPAFVVDEEDEADDGNDSTTDESEENEEEEISGSEDETKKDALTGLAQPPKVKRGTEIRLIDPVLDNVSLFRCNVLHLVVKCARCKDTTAVENIKPDQDEEGNSSGKIKTERWISCPTCNSIMGIKFYSELIHQGMKSLGLLQLAGCSAYDVLPSSYIGTCSHCMTDMASPIRLSPHDTPHTVGCFSCHSKMTFGLGEYKFVKLGSEGGERLQADESQVLKLKKKKKKQDALTIGEPLPDQGTCSHYRKSKRWFRFPCCHKLYPCDVCHDTNEDHPYELAKRHVCGLCSREQVIVNGKPCNCGHEFEKATHKGAFWEGGKGVRNKEIMSRKDPHKHKGIGKTVSKKQERVGIAGKERHRAE